MKNGKEKMMLVKEKKRILVLLLAIATVICFMPGFQAVAKAITVKSAADGTITVDYDNGGQDNYTLRKNVGEKAEFSFTATGNHEYQWYKDGKEISGAKASSYTVPSIAKTDYGTYVCKVAPADIADPVEKEKKTVKVNFELWPLSDIVFKNSADNAYIESGATATFDGTAYSTQNLTLKYQWQSYDGTNWKDISGATSATYTTPAIAVLPAEYRCKVEDPNGSVRYKVFKADKKKDLSVIVTTPQRLLFENQDVTFTATVRNKANKKIAMQWYMSDGQGNYAKVAGATGTTFTTKTPVVKDLYHQFEEVKVFCKVYNVDNPDEYVTSQTPDKSYGDNYYDNVNSLIVYKTPTVVTPLPKATCADAPNVAMVKKAGYKSLKISFAKKNLSENASVAIFDSAKKVVGVYKGMELSEKTIDVNGDTAYIAFSGATNLTDDKVEDRSTGKAVLGKPADYGYQVSKVDGVNPANGVKAYNSSIAIAKGKTKTAAVNVDAFYNAAATTDVVKAKSSKTKVAKVSKVKAVKGKITMKIKGSKAGKSTVTVTVGSKKAKIKVTVLKKKNDAKKVKASKKKISVAAGKSKSVVIKVKGKKKGMVTSAVTAKANAKIKVTQLKESKGKVKVSFMGVTKGKSTLKVKVGKKTAKVKVTVK